MFRYGAARFGMGMHDIFFNAVAGFYLASYGLPNVAIGFLANERSAVGSLLQPIVGAVSDRLRTPFGRRIPFLVLIIPVILGFLILALRPPVELVVAVFILGPLCMTIVATAYQVLLPDCVEPEQRGITNGINVLLAFVAGMILLLLAFQLWQQQPVVVFMIVAASLTIGFLITVLTVRESPPPAVVEPPASFHPLSYLKGILEHREATKYTISYFFYWFGIGGITPFVTRFGHEELNVPQNETFLLLVAVMVATLIGAAPAGWLGDHFGKKRVTSWGLVIFALFIGIGSQLQTREQAIVMLALAGLAQAVPSVLGYPLFTELVPVRRMGELTGLSTMVWSLAQPLGATALGGLADMTGTLRIVLLGGAVSLLVSWAILQLVKETEAKAEPAPIPSP
jgi:Na+/melibiose symporter-like transporter